MDRLAAEAFNVGCCMSVSGLTDRRTGISLIYSTNTGDVRCVEVQYAAIPARAYVCG